MVDLQESVETAYEVGGGSISAFDLPYCWLAIKLESAVYGRDPTPGQEKRLAARMKGIEKLMLEAPEKVVNFGKKIAKANSPFAVHALMELYSYSCYNVLQSLVKDNPDFDRKMFYARTKELFKAHTGIAPDTLTMLLHDLGLRIDDLTPISESNRMVIGTVVPGIIKACSDLELLRK